MIKKNTHPKTCGNENDKKRYKFLYELMNNIKLLNDTDFDELMDWINDLNIKRIDSRFKSNMEKLRRLL